MADVSNLTRFLGDVADSIRHKKGTTDPIHPKDFDTEISTIDASGVNTYDATATSLDIAFGKTAYASGEKVEGVVADNRGTTDEIKTTTLNDKTITYVDADNGYGGYIRVEMTPVEPMIVDDTSKVTTDVLGKIIADNIGLTPDILADGVTLLGVEGTHVGHEDVVYTELEYIESTGTQYIDTGVAVSPTIGYDTVFAFTATDHVTAETIIGGRVALQDSMIGLMWNSSGYLQFNYGNVYYNSDFTYGSDEVHYVANGKYLYVNGELIRTAGDSTWNKLYNLYLFAQNTAGSASQYASGKMKYMKIYSSDVLVRDFIPVLDRDGVACLFDKVTNTFFYSKGNSDFVGGPIKRFGAYLMESEYQGGDSTAYALGAFRANKLDYTRDKISSISFLNDGLIPENAIEHWDVSFNGDNTVTAYVCADVDGTGLFEMFIISNGLSFALPSNAALYFCNYSMCKRFAGLDLLDTSDVTNMRSMFYGCESVKVLDVHTFNTSKVTDMHGMFYHCKKASIINVTGLNTSNVTRMSWMFGSCDEISSVDAGSFDTSKVTNMSNMFYGYKYALAVNLRNADFTNVTEFENMFTPYDRLDELPYMYVYVKDQEAYDWVTTNGGRTTNVYII